MEACAGICHGSLGPKARDEVEALMQPSRWYFAVCPAADHHEPLGRILAEHLYVADHFPTLCLSVIAALASENHVRPLDRLRQLSPTSDQRPDFSKGET